MRPSCCATNVGYLPDAGHAVDVDLVDPAVGDRVPGRVEVQRQLGHVRDPSELGGLGRADDRGR